MACNIGLPDVQADKLDQPQDGEYLFRFIELIAQKDQEFNGILIDY